MIDIQSAVMQWLSSNDRACHTGAHEFDPWMVQDFFSFLVNFSSETDSGYLLTD